MAWPQGIQGPPGPSRFVLSWLYANGVGSTATRYVQNAGTATLNNEAGGRTVVTETITLVRLVANVCGVPYTTDSVTLTLRKNGVDTGLTAALLAGETQVSVTGSVPLVPGDVLTLKLVQSGTETTAGINLLTYVSDESYLAPTIAITTPTAGAIADVATPFTISGTCSAGTTAIRVKFGGVDISSDKGNKPVITGTTWTWKWSPGLLRAGTANLTAEGEIGAGPTGTSAAVSISVSNIPLRSIAHTVWHADDITGSNGDPVTSWPARVGVTGTGTGGTGTTLETAGITAGAYGTKKTVRLTSANLGKFDLNAAASLFTANQTPVYVYVFGQTIGATGSRAMFSAGSSTSSAHKWLLWQSSGAPTAMKLQKGSSTANTTFGTGTKERGDTGLHMYGGEDTGTTITLYRDAEAKMQQSASGALANTGTSGGGTAIDRVTLGAYCSAGTYSNHWDARVRGFFMTTTQPTQAQRDYLLNFFAGNYDNDQYYGDDTVTWKCLWFDGQSNTESIALADGADVVDTTIRMWNRPIANHPNDPATHAPLGPVGGYIGAWYFGPKEVKSLSGADTHVFVYAKGATGINTFNTAVHDEYFATAQLWDEGSRHFQQFLCAMGGAPTVEVNRNQGETDAQNSTAASNYGTVLTARMGVIRTRFAAASAAPIKFRHLKINTNFTGLSFISGVNSGIDSAIAGDGGLSVAIDPSDLSGSANIDGTGIHYKRGSSSAEGQWALGHRFATTAV